jgi:hypothetical protein
MLVTFSVNLETKLKMKSVGRNDDQNPEVTHLKRRLRIHNAMRR